MSEWTFLTNHARVLMQLANQSQITARDLSSLIGITERSVRSIIADLEAEGYIEKLKEGRRVNYKIHTKLPFRHPTQKDHSIEKLLKALGCKPAK
ncbi:MAG: winged helix-turn-helix transcriptional regulator [Deltaproteobacteria bacterium]|nr:winged helix-turn-helix transcriptional regulator [Deltaproteobacteria bacterium]